jgi:mRNA interferase HigB
MSVIARKNFEAFWRIHPETEQTLRAWLTAAKTQEWSNMKAVLRTFSKASPITSERCVFDICGGNYRLIVAFKFSAEVAFIKFIGTHAEVEVLAVLVAAYEDRHWPILPPDPIDALKFHMEQNGFRQKDLAGVLGRTSRASEALGRRRALTIEMIKALHAAWAIPLESLIGTESRAA